MVDCASKMLLVCSMTECVSCAITPWCDQ